MYLISTENFYIANFAVPEIASLAITTLFQICAFLVFQGKIFAQPKISSLTKVSMAKKLPPFRLMLCFRIERGLHGILYCFGTALALHALNNFPSSKVGKLSLLLYQSNSDVKCSLKLTLGIPSGLHKMKLSLPHSQLRL